MAKDELVARLERAADAFDTSIYDGRISELLREAAAALTHPATDQGESAAALEWFNARSAFLALPAGDPLMRQGLDRLSKAEDALADTIRSRSK